MRIAPASPAACGGRRRLRPAGIASCLVAVACGSGAPPASRPAADSAPSASSFAAPEVGPTLAVGGRYETQPGTIVCPTEEALRRLSDVARQGDTAAFFKGLEDARCAPVVAGAIVHVAEQRQELARVRRAGDTATYWTSADKLTPR